MNEEREKERKRDLSKYKKIFRFLDNDKKVFAEKLYTQLAFMDCTLKELKERIETEGAVIEYTNGNGFDTISENPAQKSYNAMIKNYNIVLKTLIDLIPEKQGDDELIEFIKGRK